MEVYKSGKKNAKDKPLVISVKNTQKGTTSASNFLYNEIGM